jgi:hypothetical protein
MITVVGSHGVLSMDAAGRVIEVLALCTCAECQGHGYDAIVQFDAKEWRENYPDKLLEEQKFIDILDLGYWTRNGEYVGPDETWRNDPEVSHAVSD